MLVSMLSLSNLIFSGGGDDEGTAAKNLVMHALADGDRGDGLQDPPQGPPHPLSDQSQQCSSVIGLACLRSRRLTHFLEFIDPRGRFGGSGLPILKELNMRQHRWLELLSDYDCEIRYQPGKENVVADALRKKERIKPLRVRALDMTIGLDLPSKS
uniref:Putative reverse transcriptase domain-containing protein n=1 Tax=Tanacetum cinerariifolium TaxID=118510 RepID=A0A6L2N0A5_TANCI|nr:putative reverse transcriptase domain-containing protein [Tanacetum cinerariifolium]